MTKPPCPFAPKRQPWSPPKLARLDARLAENGLTPSREDGPFSFGS
jgi:hypothetical protein